MAEDGCGVILCTVGVIDKFLPAAFHFFDLLNQMEI
jgi:hypothetical protein